MPTKEEFSKEEISVMVQQFIVVHQQVLEIYENSNGDPERKPIECPSCGEIELKYICDWYGNKHVHAHCNNCDWNFMQ